MQRSSSRLLLCAMLVLGIVPAVHAAQRTFVSSLGSDANPCSLTLPCRGFQAAITAVDPGGEVVALDTAGYGPMTIGKSVAVIVPTGIHAGITASTGSAITINGAGIIVALRGIYLNSTGAAVGIMVFSAAEVHVENCVVAGFSNQGILVGNSSGTVLSILDTIVRDNAHGGIVIDNYLAAARATVTIDRVRVERNGNSGGGLYEGGIAAVSNTDVTISNSVATGNFRGIQACGSPTLDPNAVVVIQDTVVTNNVVGLFVAPNVSTACAMLSSNSSITRNSLYGIEQQGGSVITSFGGNTVFNNAANTFGLTQGKI